MLTNRLDILQVETFQEDQEIILIVRGNGIGLPATFDITNIDSLGLYLVYNIAAKQLGGALDIHKANPTEFIVRFEVD